jgi:hypothetical protein
MDLIRLIIGRAVLVDFEELIEYRSDLMTAQKHTKNVDCSEHMPLGNMS